MTYFNYASYTTYAYYFSSTLAIYIRTASYPELVQGLPLLVDLCLDPASYLSANVLPSIGVMCPLLKKVELWSELTAESFDIPFPICSWTSCWRAMA
jgi:hypothetical protein